MKNDVVANIQANPKFHALVKTRNTYAIGLSISMLIAYFGYILLIAFNKPFLATKLGEGLVTSIGIPMGLGVILFTIAVTVIYVRRANTEFDDATAEIIKEASK